MYGGTERIDETTVLYADNAGGTLTAVDMVTGDGWQVVDGGGEGPGEFGGTISFFSESNDRIYTATFTGQAATFSLEGKVLESGAYPRAFMGPDGVGMPVGFLSSGRSVSFFQDDPDWSSFEPQTLSRGVRVQSLTEGLLWSYTDVAPVVLRVEDQGGEAHCGTGRRGPRCGRAAQYGCGCDERRELGACSEF